MGHLQAHFIAEDHSRDEVLSACLCVLGRCKNRRQRIARMGNGTTGRVIDISELSIACGRSIDKGGDVGRTFEARSDNCSTGRIGHRGGQISRNLAWLPKEAAYQRPERIDCSGLCRMNGLRRVGFVVNPRGILSNGFLD